MHVNVPVRVDGRAGGEASPGAHMCLRPPSLTARTSKHRQLAAVSCHHSELSRFVLEIDQKMPLEAHLDQDASIDWRFFRWMG